MNKSEFIVTSVFACLRCEQDVAFKGEMIWENNELAKWVSQCKTCKATIELRVAKEKLENMRSGQFVAVTKKP